VGYLYFCAVWIFNALLPPTPEQTPFETYMKNTMWQRSGDGPERDEGSIDQRQHRHQQWSKLSAQGEPQTVAASTALINSATMVSGRDTSPRWEKKSAMVMVPPNI
jgi:hypothetical protein